jgi:hypothetical protein
VRLLKDASENYPAWLEAIARARHHVHFESYLIHDDQLGRRFAAALSERARAGVQVRLIYDWLGCFNTASTRFWASLRDAGVEVRVYNRPHPQSPLGWLSRDHRKTVSVDGASCELTTREFDLLTYLMVHPGITFTKEQLMRRVWGWDFGDTSTVTVHVRRVREKIEDDPSDPRRIVTVRGAGYRFGDTAEGEEQP